MTISIVSGNGTLYGTTTISAINGVASFSNLKIVGSGNQILKAQYNTLTTQSNNINLNIPPVNSLVITSQPVSNYVNSTLGNISVSLKDANNYNIYGNKSLTITLIKNDNTVSTDFNGTKTITTNNNGIGTFSDLNIILAHNNYRFRISLDENTTINTLTNYFNILYYPVSQIHIETSIPSSNNRNEVLTLQPVIHLKNQLNEIVTQSNDLVTISIKENGGTLVGTTSINAVNGIATFTDLKITTVGTYTLQVNSLAIQKRTLIR